MSKRPNSFALIGGEVFINGKMTQADISVVDGHIVECSKNVALGEDAVRLDITGKFVLPGLIDAHTHMACATGVTDANMALQGAADALEFLRHGITSLRDMGGVHGVDLELRNAINAHILPGPLMQCAGRPLVMTGGHCHMFFGVADGRTEVLRTVREQVLAGVDFIKVFCSGGVLEEHESETAIQYSDDELHAIMDEAASQEKPVAVHAHPPKAIERAVLYGAHSIEHGSFIDIPTAALMAERNVYLVPTFLVYRILSENAEVPYLHQRAKAVFDGKFEPFTQAIRAGLPWGVGTDYAARFNDPDALISEIEILVNEASIPASEVLLAATASNAAIMGLQDRLGQIANGYQADLIVTSADPTRNIRDLRDVQITIKSGEIYEWSTIR